MSIVSWSADSKNRLNPQNGILINALHYKAIEYEYITIAADFKVLVCSELLNSNAPANEGYFKNIHIQDLILLSRFLPDIEFIKYHNQEKFRQ